MCLLGRKDCSSETETKDDKPAVRGGQPEVSLLKRNVEDLLSANSDVLTQLTTALKGDHDGVSTDTADGVSNGNDGDSSASKGPDNLSGMMHAARGGKETFEIALQLITASAARPRDLPLPLVLGLEPGSPKLMKRCEQLWAQAALGGDCDVLDDIELAVRKRGVLARYEVFNSEEACQAEGGGRGWMPTHSSPHGFVPRSCYIPKCQYSCSVQTLQHSPVAASSDMAPRELGFATRAHRFERGGTQKMRKTSMSACSSPPTFLRNGRARVLIFSLAKKTDYIFTAADLLRAACRGRRPVGDIRGYTVGELEVLDPLGGAGDDSGNLKASLFSLAVLSGKETAVKWAANFVFDNVLDKQEVSKLRAAQLRAFPSLWHVARRTV